MASCEKGGGKTPAESMSVRRRKGPSQRERREEEGKEREGCQEREAMAAVVKRGVRGRWGEGEAKRARV